MDPPEFTCQKCRYVSRRFKNVLKHYSLRHVMDTKFYVVCGIDDCSMQYKNIRSYERHLKQRHKDFHTLHVANRPDQGASADYVSLVPEEECGTGDLTIFPAEDTPIVNSHVPQLDYHHHLASFLLRLREGNNVSQATCSCVTQEMETIIQANNDQLIERVQKAFPRHRNDPLYSQFFEDIDRIHQQQMRTVKDACDSLSNPHKLQQFVSDNLNYVAPVELILGQKDGKYHAMQYVPILKTLESLLQHPEVLAEVLQDRLSQDGTIKDFCDGEYYRTNELYQEHSSSLQIELYYDDFTAANAIGSKSRSYKISAFYFILGNLSPWLRSKLDNIQLVSLCLHHEIVKNYGMSAMLQPILDDLKVLETEGISIRCEGQAHHFYGTVSFIAADNLGAHCLGRFHENFSTVQRICRFCTVTRDEMQGVFSDVSMQLRSKAVHDLQSEAVEKDATLAKAYGVKGKSPLNTLQYFHTTSGLPADIAHDCFEGVVPETTLNVLKEFVNAGFFTFPQFNDLLNKFTFARVDRSNRPPPILLVQGKPKMKYTQSQMWCFTRILPLVIGSLVPEDNKYWKLILLMLDFIEDVTAPAYYPWDIHSMRDTVQTFLSYYQECFPEENVKPKKHYVTHYPTLTKRFGPLIHCWTMRLEGKHAFFKNIFHSTRNRKNICKTMADRHQSRQAWLHSLPSYLQDNESRTGQSSEIIQLLPREVQMLLRVLCPVKETVTALTKVTIYGIAYSTGSCVVLGINDDDDYKFGVIQHIFAINGEYQLCCQIMKSTYVRHFHAYRVEDSGDACFKTVSHLFDVTPLGVYRVNHQNYVILKHHVAVKYNI